MVDKEKKVSVEKPNDGVVSVPKPGDKIIKKGLGKSEILVKTPWTRPLVDKAFPKVKFISEVTTSLTWQGIKVDIFEGREEEIPKPHYDIYLRLMKHNHSPKSPRIVIAGQVISVQHGAGLRGMD